MLRNYITIAIRNLLRHKSYSLINIIGLALGLACSIFIFLFVIHELSYDAFHKHSDRIFRLTIDGKIDKTELKGSTSCPPAAATFKEEFPEVLEAARVINTGEHIIKYDNKVFNESNIIFADSTFFNIFSFHIIKGNARNALSSPRKIVLTETTAKKYFGNKDPLGEMLIMDNDTTYYEVTGVVEDVPTNSHFDFDFIASLSGHPRVQNTNWLNNFLFTYFLIDEKADYKALTEKFKPIIEKNVAPLLESILNITTEEFAESGNKYYYKLQPLSDIHLNSEIGGGFKPTNDRRYIYIFSFIAVIIIIIACINFMNLATARSANRAKEIGMRKVFGSGRAQLIRQFLAESVFLSFIALFLALVFVQLILPGFSAWLGIDLTVDYFGTWYLIPSFVLLALFVGILAGSYPAFYLSAFKPVFVLKGKTQKGFGSKKSSLFRSVLVVLQFAISLILILATFLIYLQINYMLTKDLGFERDNIVVIRDCKALNHSIRSFKNELLKNTNIIAVTNSSSIPSMSGSYNGFQIKGRKSTQTYLVDITWADFDFVETFGLEVVKGRDFSLDLASDSNAVLINQQAVKQIEIEKPLQTRFISPGYEDSMTYLNVIGVIKDFNYLSLHTEIRPYMLAIRESENTGGFMSIRIKAGNRSETLSYIEEKWSEFTDLVPFEYEFLNERFQRMYEEEQRTKKIITVFSLFAISIACLGLLGLVSFSAIERTKEIGIRKTLGASTSHIIVMLVKETALLLLIAFVFALPFSYLITVKWLETYTYRIDFTIGLFAIMALAALLIVMIIAFLSVAYITFRSARQNPVKALRYE